MARSPHGTHAPLSFRSPRSFPGDPAARRNRRLARLLAAGVSVRALRWELLLLSYECGRKSCRLVAIIRGQLAIDHETEEVVLERSQPRPWFASKNTHQVVAVKRAADRHTLGLLAQSLATLLQITDTR